MPAEPLVTLSGVHKRFGAFKALSDISLSVAPGEKVVVCGPSGSGKSSLFHALILSLCARYSPEEVELYLLDMKPGGVEFAAYRGLRHARFVALGEHGQDCSLHQ